MSSEPASAQTTLFERRLVIDKKRRQDPESDFLLRHCCELLIDRLTDITVTFPLAADLGAHVPQDMMPRLVEHGGVEHLFRCGITGENLSVMSDEEMIPFQESLDLIISHLSLHKVNDLPGTLIQIRRALKPNGLFLGCLYGGETLHQLRHSLQHAELELSGGLHPRVMPFIDKQQAGGLLQRAGFALPVVDSERITVTYPSLHALMRDLRGMAETNILKVRKKTFDRKALFQRAEEIYREEFSDADGRLEAMFEVIFLIGWAPHDSQQKPMRPGSAKTGLADALGTKEIGSGEKPI